MKTLKIPPAAGFFGALAKSCDRHLPARREVWYRLKTTKLSHQPSCRHQKILAVWLGIKHNNKLEVNVKKNMNPVRSRDRSAGKKK